MLECHLKAAYIAFLKCRVQCLSDNNITLLLEVMPCLLQLYPVYSILLCARP